MKTKHMNGPWRIGKGTPNGIHEFKGHIQIENDAWDIAAVFKDGGTTEECKANAKLISAAPELFTACIQALDNMENGEASTKYRHMTVIESLRTAIKKATT